MTAEQIAAIVARQLVAESRYLEAASSFPAIRAERRRILDETERELACAVIETLACSTSGRPPDDAGFPDAVSDPSTMMEPR